MNPNGKLTDFILRGRALLSLLQEAGANYKIINPRRSKEKGDQ